MVETRYRRSTLWEWLYPLRKKLYPFKKWVMKRLRPVTKFVYHRPRAKLELALLNVALKRRYGSPISTVIDPEDEMYRFLVETWDSSHHTSPMADSVYALRSYLAVTDQNVGELEDVLNEAGRPFAEIPSFLEFACGHGRMTRFLVHRLDPARITVSDINPSAVAFTSETFGVRGFCSVKDPRDLDQEDQYEVVFVGSLFTHLSLRYWEAWLQRLYSLVSPGGLLIFTTHSLGLVDEYGDEWKSQLECPAEGFFFVRTNETHGRLSTGYYGGTFVTEDYVRRFIEVNALGHLRTFHPMKLNRQDVYVLART
jgi:SAM-dependent methyltransferase